jgi:hypothetical protein
VAGDDLGGEFGEVAGVVAVSGQLSANSFSPRS